MAEMVGLVAAIGSIIGAGYKITKAISAAREDIGAAEASVQAIATDTAFVTMILGQIRDRLNSIRVVEVETLKILEGILLQCKTDIDAIEKTLLPIISNVKSGGFKSKRQRIRFLFARSKLCTQRATLGSLKLTLSLFIHTLQLSDGYDVEILKDEILDAISKSKDTKTIFLNAERVDHAVAKACEIRDRASITENSSPRTVMAIEDTDRPVLPGRAISLSAFHDSEPGADMVDLASDPANWQLQLRSTSEFEVMQSISDDSFMKIADHMRLQKSVAAFALGSMEPGPKPTDVRKPRFELDSDRDEGVSLQDGYSAETGSVAGSVARTSSEEHRSSIREGKQPQYPFLAFHEKHGQEVQEISLNPGEYVPPLSTELQSEAETVVDTAGVRPPSDEPPRKQDLHLSEEDGRSYALVTGSSSTQQADSTPRLQQDTDVLPPPKVEGIPETLESIAEDLGLQAQEIQEAAEEIFDQVTQRAAAGMDQEALVEKVRKQTEDIMLREIERITKTQPTVEERMARMQAEAEIERRHQEELIRVREEAWDKASAQYKLHQYRGIDEPRHNASAAKTVKSSKRKKFRQLLGLGRSSRGKVIVSG
ncbi:hypothetical protein B0J18DRAFT_119248 [Chaetomium sp. MPI-SDFR-AT-0129]|nr:hypothetical protein B0J18DRAFT_119248 [Chaetomium sp. MPI-SDFR-AT-0129]